MKGIISGEGHYSKNEYSKEYYKAISGTPIPGRI